METTTNELKNVQTLLKFTYGLVPIIAGADKFTNLLTNWEQYLPQSVVGMLPFGAHTFMMIVGVIEIIAGVLVLVKPQQGGYVVTAWLLLIAVTLIAGGTYFDVAVRDVVMAIGAYSLVKITKVTGN